MRATPPRARSVHDRPSQSGASPTSTTRATHQRRRDRANRNVGLNSGPNSCWTYLPVLSEFLNRQVIRRTGTRAAPAPAPATPPPMRTRAPPVPTHRSAGDNARARLFPASSGAEYLYSALLGQRFVEGELEIQVQWEPTRESVRNFDRKVVAAMQRELRHRRCARRL
ncbi:hypothetical protein ON010_g642 [Phytophthora cinnamomi]|nr:hypothetical protein ON010_g642 [Phytophthora cinnamomi]